MVRGMRAAIVAVALATVPVACGSSSGSDAASPTTAAPAADETTTTAAPPDDTSTTSAPDDAPGTTVAALEGLPSCQEILQQYADTFTMDDLAPTAALFRQWAPFMPDDVAAASISLAEAYEAAGDGSGLNMADVDLSADATTFSDWTNDGCPAG